MGLLKAFGVSTRKEKKLKETGVAIKGTVARIGENTNVTVNGAYPKNLVCEAAMPDGTMRYFESANVPKTIHPSVIGQQVDIYYDPENPKKYYVDIEKFK
ncbi:DUF3592 domain-containing protein [uncultured Ruminococcus sp.]|uniref:DUF3592 domain-containing protein n=1 Tax=uncultured Ruminococcus sp. TaxID=165186 RepID=UPI002930866B|nr:hypothetical protein [uncultured Ruminococcus sp.]